VQKVSVVNKIWANVLLLCVISPLWCMAETLTLSLPDSYTGYKPVGLYRYEQRWLLAGDAQSGDSGWDISLLWFTPDYSIAKQRILKGNGSDTVSKILNMDGEFLLLARTSSLKGDLKKKNGILDIALIRFNKGGNIVWQRTLGGTGVNYAQDVSVCAAKDGLAVLGWIDSSGGDILKVHGGWDIVVAKYTASGDREWVQVLGDSSDDTGGSMTCAQGKFYIVYNTWIKGRKWDFKLTVLDFKGNIIEERSYGGSGSDIAHKIIQTRDQDFLVLYSTDSMDFNAGKSHGKVDIGLVSIDPIGEILWESRLGGAQDDFGQDIVVGADGYFWVLGSTQSFDGDIQKHIGGWDVGLFKIKDNGHLLNTATYGTPNDDYPVQLIPTKEYLMVLYGKNRSKTFSQPFLIKHRYEVEVGRQ
jgi:hypothetical protein